MFEIDKPERIAETGSRSVHFRWPLQKLSDLKTLYAELTVMHHKRGANYFSGTHVGSDYFSVGLKNIKIELQPGLGTIMSFGLFQGLELMKIPAGNRFSQKRLADAAEKGLAECRRLYKEGDPRVLAYFTVEEQVEEVAV